MALFLKFYEREIYRYLALSALFLWALFVSISLLVRKDHLVVIRVDEFGTTVLTDENPDSVTVETENFINDFVSLFYNYTSTNFESHIDRSFIFIKDDVAERFVSRLNEMSEKVKLRETHQKAVASKILKIKEGLFEVDLFVTKTVGIDETSDKYKIRIELDRTQRSIQNPYGLIITGLEEVYE